jgi:hypothetical protein
MYKPDPYRMALLIAANSLKSSREGSTQDMLEWYDGRSCAAALIHPCVETIAAANECRFLTGYHRRHNHV